MTQIELFLDVQQMRDQNPDKKWNDPETTFVLGGADVRIVLTNIPLDQVELIEDLNKQIAELRRELFDAPSQSTVNYLRDLCESYRRELATLKAKHAPDDIKAIVKANLHSKINAIKEIRTATGWALKEAKDFVDGVWDLCKAEVEATANAAPAA